MLWAQRASRRSRAGAKASSSCKHTELRRAGRAGQAAEERGLWGLQGLGGQGLELGFCSACRGSRSELWQGTALARPNANRTMPASVYRRGAGGQDGSREESWRCADTQAGEGPAQAGAEAGQWRDLRDSAGGLEGEPAGPLLNGRG